MDLFTSPLSHFTPGNLLPFDGQAYYYGPILSSQQADFFYQQLLDTVSWTHDQTLIYGKLITTRRKVAWYGDHEFSYTYSGITKTALPFTHTLIDLKQRVEKISDNTYNTCLLNLYHDGSEGMGWHSDDEKELKKHGAIASLSLGATRRFCFRHKKTKETISVTLEHGSLLMMQGQTQTFWSHSLPKAMTVKAPRINLTFRTIVTSG